MSNDGLKGNAATTPPQSPLARRAGAFFKDFLRGGGVGSLNKAEQRFRRDFPATAGAEFAFFGIPELGKERW
jgi:hypothetical protein